jgi:hypothetical protein
MTDRGLAEVAHAWWQAIDRADFEAAAALMAPGSVVDWPLSNERMSDASSWKAVNEHYPGRWAASVRQTVSEGDTVVTVAEVTDGTISVQAISFFTISEGLITRLIEYWPEPYAAPAGRSQWTMPILSPTAIDAG